MTSSGSMPHHPDSGFVAEDGNIFGYANTVMEARIQNPYSTSKGEWSTGFQLRNSDQDSHIVLINSNGCWEHLIRTAQGGNSATRLNFACSDDISLSPQGTNLVRVVADGRQGLLYVNGVLMEALNLEDLVEGGGSAIFGSYYAGTQLEGMSTDYSEYKVWDLGEK